MEHRGGAASPGEPGWLRALRREAAAWVAGNGFPTRKDEDWRYADLGPLFEGAFAVSPTREIWSGAEVSRLLEADLGGPRLVFVNGRFAPVLSRRLQSTDGIKVAPFSQAIEVDPEGVGHLWAGERGPYLHGFDALNSASFADGYIVELLDGARIDTPVELFFVTVASEYQPLVNVRSRIVAGVHSSATFVETYVGAGDGASLTNAWTEVSLGEGAAIGHYTIQDQQRRAFHLSALDVRSGPASRFRSRLLGLGALLGRHEMRVVLAGEGSAADLAGLYLPTGNQCHDNPVLVEHVAPACTSTQLYKGIADGAGRGVFNGHVIVRPGAIATDALQTNKNLLLSDRAEVDTRPRLEIFADDVACTHGAAVGQLDDDAIFYLRSRGIPQQMARAVLTSGFAKEVLDSFEPAGLRVRAERLVGQRLYGDTGTAPLYTTSSLAGGDDGGQS